MSSRAISSDGVFGPLLGDVEGDDTDRGVVMAGHQIGNHGFQIGPFGIGLRICTTQGTEVVEHEINIQTVAGRHNRRGPASTHTQLAATFNHRSRKRSCAEINFRPNLAKADGDWRFSDTQSVFRSNIWSTLPA